MRNEVKAVSNETTKSHAGRSRSPFQRFLRVIQLSAGFCFIASGGYWVGVGGAGLPTISLVRPSLVYPGQETGIWLFMTLVVAAGLALWFTPNSWSHSRTDFVQLSGAVILTVLVLAFLPFVSGPEFLNPSMSCVYDTCWPQPYQEMLLAAPVLMGALAMGVCAVIGGRMRLRLRIVLPVSLYVLLAIVQYATWQPIIVPFLAAPASN
jgi:hypothetical protein